VSEGGLPTTKGTETFPATIKTPVKTVVSGVPPGAAAQAVYEKAQGAIKQFYSKAAQGHALGLPDSTYRQATLPGGLRARYVNQFGLETVYIEVPAREAKIEKVDQPRRGEPADWALIDIVVDIPHTSLAGLTRTCPATIEAISPTLEETVEFDTEDMSAAIGEVMEFAGFSGEVIGDTTIDTENQQYCSLLIDLRGRPPDQPIEIELWAEMDSRTIYADADHPPTTKRLAAVIRHGGETTNLSWAAFPSNPDTAVLLARDPTELIETLYPAIYAATTGQYTVDESFLADYLPPGVTLDTEALVLSEALADPGNFDFGSLDDFHLLEEQGKRYVVWYTANWYTSPDMEPYAWASGFWVEGALSSTPGNAPSDVFSGFPQTASVVTTALPFDSEGELGAGSIRQTGELAWYSEAGGLSTTGSGTVGTPPPTAPEFPFAVDGTIGFSHYLPWVSYLFVPQVEPAATATIRAGTIRGTPEWVYSTRRAQAVVDEEASNGEPVWDSWRWEIADQFPDRIELGEIAAIEITQDRRQVGTLTVIPAARTVSFTPA
jgi:hypothetical protein